MSVSLYIRGRDLSLACSSSSVRVYSDPGLLSSGMFILLGEGPSLWGIKGIGFNPVLAAQNKVVLVWPSPYNGTCLNQEEPTDETNEALSGHGPRLVQDHRNEYGSRRHDACGHWCSRGGG